MKKITRILLYPFKNILGLGYGKCFCCSFPYNLVDPEPGTTVVGYRGCFAVCEDCWRNKTDQEIIDAYNRVYDDWLCGDKYNKPHTVSEIGFTRSELLEALDKRLRERKKL